MAAELEHFGCSCVDEDGPICVTHSSVSAEMWAVVFDHRTAFTTHTSDKMLGPVPEKEYSDGRYVTENMRRKNRSRKTEKQWRLTQQERSVLRYTTG